MLKKGVLVVVLSLLMLFAAACAEGPEEEVVEEPVEGPEEEAAEEHENMMGKVDEPLNMDGSSEGYPLDPVEASGAAIYLAYDEEYIYVLMEAEVEGWVSVGINESGGGMDGANMVLGYLTDDGEPAYRDDVGRGRSHSEVETDAVAQPFIDRSEGKTVLEFAYPLSFPADEGYNVEEIVAGETYELIIGMHRDSDDISRQHSTRDSAEFQVQP